MRRRLIRESLGINDNVRALTEEIVEAVKSHMNMGNGQFKFMTSANLPVIVEYKAPEFVQSVMRTRSPFKGYYDKNKNLIYITVNHVGEFMNEQNLYETVAHEVTHFFQFKYGQRANMSMYQHRIGEDPSLKNLWGLRKSNYIKASDLIKGFYYRRVNIERDAFISGIYHRFLQIGKLPDYKYFEQQSRLPEIYSYYKEIKSFNEEDINKALYLMNYYAKQEGSRTGYARNKTQLLKLMVKCIQDFKARLQKVYYKLYQQLQGAPKYSNIDKAQYYASNRFLEAPLV